MIPYFGRQRIYHTDLIDMPGITNADHDGRYLLLTGGTVTGALTVGGTFTANNSSIFNNSATFNNTVTMADRLNLNGHTYVGDGQRIYFDTNDYFWYDRADDSYGFVIGGAVKAIIRATRIDGFQFYSALPTGTKPLDVQSTTLCNNLNADKLDGYDAGNASGNVPVSNGNTCTNLNADMVDDSHLLQFYDSPATLNTGSFIVYTLGGLTVSDRVCANVIAKITAVIDIEWWLSQYDSSAVKLHVFNLSGSNVDVGFEAMAFRPG